MSCKYSQKFPDYAKQSESDALKTSSKTFIQKTAEAIGDLIADKIVIKITIVSRISPQNNSKTVTNENDKEILKARYISPEERLKKSQKIAEATGHLIDNKSGNEMTKQFASE